MPPCQKQDLECPSQEGKDEENRKIPELTECLSKRLRKIEKTEII